MNEINNSINIENLIYELRGKQVMLDSDLARLYECKNGTKEVNQAVKNNIDKFPERYCFQLNNEEVNVLQTKILTAKLSTKSRINPRVCTEQGVYMLATVLKSKRASAMALYIMDAFVLMKKVISTEYVNNSILVNHENRILKLEESFEKISSNKYSIVYEGKIYDSYSLLLNIFNEANDEIIIIDNFANKELFDTLRSINKKIKIFSKNLDEILIKKYNEQYSNINFFHCNLFHDRYIILDRKFVYISGMSLKDIGKKYSYIYKMNEKLFVDELILKVVELIEMNDKI